MTATEFQQRFGMTGTLSNHGVNAAWWHELRPELSVLLARAEGIAGWRPTWLGINEANGAVLLVLMGDDGHVMTPLRPSFAEVALELSNHPML